MRIRTCLLMLSLVALLLTCVTGAVAQSGLCIYVLSPTILYFEPEGGSQEVQVKASSPGCSFVPRTRYPWIKASVKWEGALSVVTVDVEPQRLLSPRVGAVLIDGTQLEVVQKQSNLLSW